VADIDRLDEVALPEAAAFVAALQADPGHHIGYLGTEVEALAEQLRELEPAGVAGTVIARDGEGEILGLLGAEWDTDPPRVWWHGPMARDAGGWDHLADRLYEAARDLLPAEVTEEELAPDERNRRVEAFAQRHGFARGVASAVLRCALTEGGPLAVPEPDGVVVSGFSDAHRAEVAALHDQLFPRTHMPGARLDEGRDRIVLVAHRSDVLVGYVAAEVQEDGEGYLDYLGVAPAVQGQGIGALLVAAACERLRDAGSSRVHLTVREDNPAARGLYARLGFTEERLLVPWRRPVSR
jgi:ribosomal protein S18 acetylase RimI-like enzyme